MILGQSSWPVPKIRVASSAPEVTVKRDFPLFFEDQEYQILVQGSRSQDELTISHDDASIIQGIQRVSGIESPTLIGTFSFRQVVGLSTFVISQGSNTISITVEVFPSKFEHLEDYETMVEDLREADRTLPLRFAASTFTESSAEREKYSADLEWLTLLRAEIGSLEASLGYANSHPLLSSRATESTVRATKARGSSATIRRAIVRGGGHGPWVDGSTHIPRLRKMLPTEATRDSLDCVEHTWIRLNLQSILRRIQSLARSLRTNSEAARSRQISDSNVRQATVVEALSARVKTLLRLRILSHASSDIVPSNFSSIRMLRTHGYSSAYLSLTRLRQGLSGPGKSVDISLLTLGALYESWCYLKVFQLLRDATVSSDSFGPSIGSSNGWTGARLVRGLASEVRFDIGDGRLIRLKYNRHYEELTGTQIPDIELTFESPDEVPVVVILDAKYRVDRNKKDSSSSNILSPPQDAINALHRYRDAITTFYGKDGNQRFRPVAMAAALYPLNASQSYSYLGSRLQRSLVVDGIGALPILPGNVHWLENFIMELIHTPHRELVDKWLLQLRPDIYWNRVNLEAIP